MSEIAIKLTDLRKTFDGKDFVVQGMDMEIPKGSLLERVNPFY
jgi:ABC-type multidrug transport system ATPase subunit